MILTTETYTKERLAQLAKEKFYTSSTRYIERRKMAIDFLNRNAIPTVVYWMDGYRVAAYHSGSVEDMALTICLNPRCMRECKHERTVQHAVYRELHPGQYHECFVEY